MKKEPSMSIGGQRFNVIYVSGKSQIKKIHRASSEQWTRLVRWPAAFPFVSPTPPSPTVKYG